MLTRLREWVQGMKQGIFFLALLSAASLQAQNAPNPGQQVISHGQALPNTNTAPAGANPTAATSAASLSFTNRSGQSFTVDQLAAQLRTLRNNVDQTLPVLSAFNESFAGVLPGGSASSTGLSNLLSGVFHHNSGQSGAPPASQSTNQLNSVVAALRGLLTTNATPPAQNAPQLNSSTVQQLATLQSDLQAIEPILSNLHMGGAAPNASPSQGISAWPGSSPGSTAATNQNNPPLSPTGR